MRSYLRERILKMENLSVTDVRLRLLEDNLKRVRDEIAETAVKNGRDPQEVKLMAVTKTVSVELINHAIACGVDLIGENKVQEVLLKRPELNLEHCKLHLIGHLQSNKIKKIVGQVDMIQSVDSFETARQISRRSGSRDKNRYTSRSQYRRGREKIRLFRRRGRRPARRNSRA